MAAISFACYTCSGVERGRGTGEEVTIGCALAAALGVLGFIWRERRRDPHARPQPVSQRHRARGATPANWAGSILMAAVMFGL
ncbi:MAG: hypothetical protein R2742_15070 [Micropruina glycogenica]